MKETDEVQQQEIVQATPDQNRAPMAPRWIATVGALLFGILYAALPPHVVVGPTWIPLVIEVVLLVPISIAQLLDRPFSHLTIRTLNLIVLGVVTLALLTSIGLMIYKLPIREIWQGGQLLRTAGVLWPSNVLVFALWYWEIDGGGPGHRYKAGHQAADFMFPQQAGGNDGSWAPHFLDYLFVAFTAATALSPADTYPLTRTAKMLMMIEAIIALLTLAILAGRAVNIL